MKTIEYQLFSKPWKRVSLPQVGWEEANNLIDNVRECKTPDEVNKLIRGNPNFKWMYELDKSALITKSNYLRYAKVGTARVMKFKDEVYLTIGAYYAGRELKEIKDINDSIEFNLNNLSSEDYLGGERKSNVKKL